jgi:hypothetical protein
LDYSSFVTSNKEVIGYVNTQRTQYFGHADEVSWENFPSIWDKEYEKIINDIKDLLLNISKITGSQVIPNPNQKFAEKHTDKLFDALLTNISPSTNIATTSAKFKQGLSEFMQI